jgi:NAD(P)-dependent dehydrogenase (short-subunit alcohol dehydrogenase family)
MDDVLGYAGKRVIVSGAASGMGAATASLLVDLGAEVHTIDIRRPEHPGLASYTEADLREPEQIDAAVARIGGIVNALFNCAGLPNTFPDLDVMLVNFCGLRQLTERVVPLMVEGAAVASIASVAGMAWLANLPTVMELLATPDFAAAREWYEQHAARAGNGYEFSKQAINGYTAARAVPFAERGVRINCVNPGPTDTPMMPHFEQAMGKAYMDNFPKPVGRNARPEEQAWPLVFLNSPRASYITGTALFVDGGFTGGLYTGRVDASVLVPQESKPGADRTGGEVAETTR